MTLNFKATNTQVLDCQPGATIKLESAIAASTAADVGKYYLVLMLYGPSGHVWEQIMWSAPALTTTPQTISTIYKLPATLPAGKYSVSASVRDMGWHWLTVTQAPAAFNVGAVAAPVPVSPKPLRVVANGFMPDDGVVYAPIAGASDEFTGTTLDRSKWWIYYKDNGGTLDHYNNEVGRYGPNHVLTGSELQMTARPRATGTYTAPNGNVYKLYDTAMIRSRTLVERGYIEARIWNPPGFGMFPAFWILPQYEWPPEIDIMEQAFEGVNEKPGMIHMCETSGGPSAPSVVWHDPAFNTQWNFLANVSNDYHHYGLLWDADGATEWLDGKPVCQKQFGWKTNAGADGGLASIIINLAVGGNWATHNYTVPISTGDQTMHVDYVRCWQRADAIKTGVSPI